VSQPERVGDILPRVWARLQLGPLHYRDPRLEAFRERAHDLGWPTLLTLHEDDTVTVSASTTTDSTTYDLPTERP
jgi:hypothetical protein